LTEDGFVSSVTLGDGSGKFYFTEALFLFEDYKAGEVLLYNRDGSVALKMKYINYQRDRKIYYSSLFYFYGL